MSVDASLGGFSGDYTIIGKFFQNYQFDFIKENQWKGTMLSSNELAQGLVLHKKQPVVNSLTERVRDPIDNDRGLNMSVYFDTRKEYHDDIKKFLRLVKYFRMAPADQIILVVLNSIYAK